MKTKTSFLAVSMLVWLTLTNASAFYDPGVQRWINRDPIGEAGALNLYQPANNNPVSLVDAWGLDVGGRVGPGYPYDGYGSAPIIIPRNDWSTAQPNFAKMTPATVPNNCIAVHHSGNGGEKNPKGIEAEHIKGKGFDDVGYHFLIGPDGKIYEGRSLKYEGAHVLGKNPGNIGIIVMGDFEPNWWDDDDEPTSAQLGSLNDLLFYLQNKFPIEKIGGHKDFAEKNPTECPGSVLDPLIPKKGSK